MTDPDDALVARLRAAGCVWAEDEAVVLETSRLDQAVDDNEFERWVRRRESGEPLETIVGWAMFRGLRIRVDRGVFVPRPRTALLVDLALDRVPRDGIVADLCCGSGALGAAILAERPDVELVASDIDPVAVAVARRNLPGIPISVAGVTDAVPSDLRGRVDVIVANVPYVPSAEVRLLPPEARNHEPRHALDGGPDGLDVLRGLASAASSALRPGGTVLSEVEGSQADAALDVFQGAGLAASTHYSDEYETTAVLGIRR